MGTVLLTVTAAWLALCALVTLACALVARGGLREDRRRARLDRELARLLDEARDGDASSGIPRPRVTTG